MCIVKVVVSFLCIYCLLCKCDDDINEEGYSEYNTSEESSENKVITKEQKEKHENGEIFVLL